jgi:cation diffusion facilitator family transporter
MSVNIAFITTLVLNIIIATTKFTVGTFLRWPSLAADGIHTFSDGLTNIIALVSIRFAQKPKDENHPYGHGRIESLAMMVIVAFLVYLSFEVMTNGINQILSPVPIVYNVLMIWMLAISFAFDVTIVSIKFFTGKKLNHRLLLADAKHSFTDMLSTVLVAMSALCVVGLNFDPRFDGVLSILIGFLIFKIAIDVFRESAKELLDEAVLDPQLIENIVLKHPLVHSIHEIRSRLSGKLIYVDFHVQCDPELTLITTHTLVHDLEVLIQKELGEHIHVIVHCEPVGHHYHRRGVF